MLPDILTDVTTVCSWIKFFRVYCGLFRPTLRQTYGSGMMEPEVTFHMHSTRYHCHILHKMDLKGQICSFTLNRSKSTKLLVRRNMNTLVYETPVDIREACAAKNVFVAHRIHSKLETFDRVYHLFICRYEICNATLSRTFEYLL